MMANITLSIVSHNQAHLVCELLNDIEKYCDPSIVKIIITLNLPEVLPVDVDQFSFEVALIKNLKPKGFGANHNQAFEISDCEYFCILNPDIRFNEDPFPSLINCLETTPIGVITPLVINHAGLIEDNGRRFPSPLQISFKLLGIYKNIQFEEKNDLKYPDWIGGMFMLFPKHVYHSVKGFDDGYFLYYEDVDLCARLNLEGYSSAIYTKKRVVHNARRDSHSQLRYLKWHITSMLRFFLSRTYIRIQTQKLSRLNKKNSL
jgi:N-acetylglucosaminyl-diphospho-decaprenol L-rhamnosyltransferase